MALKALRETEIWLNIITKAKMIKSAALVAPLLQETGELIAILFKRVETAKSRSASETSRAKSKAR